VRWEKVILYGLVVGGRCVQVETLEDCAQGTHLFGAVMVMRRKGWDGMGMG